jgi:hypothetical protein
MMGGNETINRKAGTTLGGRLGLVGAGMGLVLFALFGILYGSLLGGIVGLNLAGAIFGSPVEPSVLSRVIIALGMLLGVMISGLIFISGTASIGWLIGTAIERLTAPAKTPETKKVHLK